jgi:hypothetical protein
MGAKKLYVKVLVQICQRISCKVRTHTNNREQSRTFENFFFSIRLGGGDTHLTPRLRAASGEENFGVWHTAFWPAEDSLQSCQRSDSCNQERCCDQYLIFASFSRRKEAEFQRAKSNASPRTETLRGIAIISIEHDVFYLCCFEFE